MKVVLLHDWLTGFRGGERILEAFCEMFPDAPIYTLIHKKGSTSPLIESKRIHTSFLQNIPMIFKHYRKFLPLMPLAVKSIFIKQKPDLVLSSSHCLIKGVTIPQGSKHLCYIHSPMRYLYDQFSLYFDKAPFYQRWGMNVFKQYLMKKDIQGNQGVDRFIANSSFVQNRILTYYQKKSFVVHPFVEYQDFTPTKKKQDYYLALSSFAPNKRLDLAIKAFIGTGKKLKIIGQGQQQQWLQSIADDCIEFLGPVSRKSVVTHLQEAKALIFPGIEDFGITPLEALSAGTPVIAFKGGGVLETLNDKVAVFFDQQNVQSLKMAITKLEKKSFELSDFKNQVQSFSKDHFKQKITNHIKEVLQ